MGFLIKFSESREANKLLFYFNKIENIGNKLNYNYKNYNYNSKEIRNNITDLNKSTIQIIDYINYYENYYNSNLNLLWHSSYCNNLKYSLYNIQSNKIIIDNNNNNYNLKYLIGAVTIVSLACIAFSQK